MLKNIYLCVFLIFSGYAAEGEKKECVLTDSDEDLLCECFLLKGASKDGLTLYQLADQHTDRVVKSFGDPNPSLITLSLCDFCGYAGSFYSKYLAIAVNDAEHYYGLLNQEHAEAQARYRLIDKMQRCKDPDVGPFLVALYDSAGCRCRGLPDDEECVLWTQEYQSLSFDLRKES